jgi:hypothetical protein
MVFKKVGDYLLAQERMPKHNVLAMLEEIEVGCVREEVFWRVVEDIMNIKASHLKKMRKSCSRSKVERMKSKTSLAPSNKENVGNVLLMPELKPEAVKKPVI